MKMPDEMQKQIYSLKRKLYFAYLVSFLAIVIQFIFFLNPRSEASEEQVDYSGKVLKVKGLIVVDEKKHERILIGSPIPEAQNRVRTDLRKVRELWSVGFPDREQYMKWYQNYNHKANGIVILDENGFDRVALGDVPDPNIGKRIGKSNGLIINDEKGFERGGFGLLKVGETNRITLGLDTNRGTEGIGLSVADEGGIGISIFDASRRQITFLGNAPPKHWATNSDEPFSGLLMRDDKKAKYKLNFLEKK